MSEYIDSACVGRISALLAALADALIEATASASSEEIAEAGTDPEVVSILQDTQEVTGRRKRGARPPVEAIHTGMVKPRLDREAFEPYELCLHKLTVRQREVVCLHFRDGKSQSEIATLLGIKRGAVSGVLQRADQRMDEYHALLRAQKARIVRNSMD